MEIICLGAITKQLQLWQKFCRICKKYSTRRFNCDPRRTNKDTKKLQPHSRKPVKKQLLNLKRVLKQIYCWYNHKEREISNILEISIFFSIQVLNACIQQKNVYYRVSIKLKFEM